MARYDRYDTGLRVERGRVTPGMNRSRNDARAAYGYGHDFEPWRRTHGRRPSELRGATRGGAAFGYGFGNDYDRVYRYQPGRERPQRWGERPDRAGYGSRWVGSQAYPDQPFRPGPRRGYDSGAGYDRGHGGWHRWR